MTTNRCLAAALALAFSLAAGAGESGRGGGGPSSERQRVVEWVAQLRSPFVDERLEAINRLSMVADKNLAGEFRISNLFVAIAEDPREFERIRSQALRGLGRLHAMGIAPNTVIGSILAVTSGNLTGETAGSTRPDHRLGRSERVAADALDLLIELGLGADPIVTGQQLRPGQIELKRVWDRTFAEYVRDLEGIRTAPVGTTLPPLLSGRTYGRMLAAFGALSFNDRASTTDFLVEALTRQNASSRERAIFNTLPQRNRDGEIIVGALEAIRYDLELALFATGPGTGGGTPSRDQQRVQELIEACGTLVKNLPQPSQHPVRMAVFPLVEMLASAERTALLAGTIKPNVEATRRVNNNLDANIYPILETTTNDEEAGAVVRIMMQRLDPRVAERLMTASLPRPAGQPQLHIETLRKINSALTESVRQLLEVLRQGRTASSQVREKQRESGDQILKIGQHLIGLLASADAPTDIRRTAATGLGFWPPELKSLDWREDLGTSEPPARPAAYQDMEWLAVGALVGTLAADLDKNLLESVVDSLTYLTGQKFEIFDPDKLEVTGPDVDGWKVWWQDAKNQQRFKPQPPLRTIK